MSNQISAFDLTGRVATVTGGNDGIGRSITLGMNAAIPARTPANRWGHRDEMAGAAVVLASAAYNLITGTTLPIDGGYCIA